MTTDTFHNALLETCTSTDIKKINTLIENRPERIAAVRR